MFEILKKFFKFASEQGLRLPFAYDPVFRKPSVTLFFAYVAFTVAFFSLVFLHFYHDLLTATAMSFLFAFIMIVFYLIKSINKAKIDLNDQQIELESGEKNDSKSN